MLGKRKGADVVDFTLLEKVRKKNKKLHSTEPTTTSTPSVPSVGGFLDFTSVAPQSPHTGTETPTFGFLSDFAQSSGSLGTADVTSKLTNPDAEVNALKLKIDDLEYKLDRLLERLSEMETKITRV